MEKEQDFIAEVEKTALLARLNLSFEKKARFAKEIKSVLDHFQDIKGLEIGSVEKLDHYSLLKNQTRPDCQQDFSLEGREKIKEAFPKRKGEYLKVTVVL